MSRTVSALCTALALAGALFATPAFAQASLEVTIAAPTDPDTHEALPIQFGGTGDYVVTVTNTGDAAAAAPSLTATLPASDTYPEGLALAGADGCTLTADDFPCVLADIPAGESATVTLTLELVAPAIDTKADVPTTCVTEAGDVTVDVAYDDTTASATLASADNPVYPLAIIATEATGPTSGGKGSNLTFEVLVTNLGPCVAPAVVGANVVAYGQATAISATAGSTECTVSEDQSEVDCDLGDLPPSGDAAYTVNFKVGSDFSSDLITATDYFDFTGAGDFTDLGGWATTENAVKISVNSESGCSSSGAGAGLLGGLLAVLFLARRRRVSA